MYKLPILNRGLNSLVATTPTKLFLAKDCCFVEKFESFIIESTDLTQRIIHLLYLCMHLS